MTPPDTSLRVGVVGRSPLAALWAVVLRDYGRHRVIGYALDPNGLRDPEAVERWDNTPIACTPQMRRVPDFADVIFVFGQRWWPILNIQAASRDRGDRPTLVVSRWMPAAEFYGLAISPDRATPVAYSPLLPTFSIDELTNPPQIWACAEERRAQEQIERVWRTINNKIPVTQVGLPKASATPSPWSPVAYAESVGLMAPQAVESLAERPGE